MDPTNEECMFCHEGLDGAQPENLAFMDHIGDAASCQDAFDAWTTNMQTDFLGD